VPSLGLPPRTVRTVRTGPNGSGVSVQNDKLVAPYPASASVQSRRGLATVSLSMVKHSHL